MPRSVLMLPLIKRYKETYQRYLNTVKNPDNPHLKQDFLYYYHLILKTKRNFLDVLLACRKMYKEYENLKEEVADLEKMKKKLYNEIDKLQKHARDKYNYAYFSEDEEIAVRDEVKLKQGHLARKKEQVDKMEQELIIKQEELEIAIQDTNLAKSSYYFLTDDEIELFERQRERILKGIEKWGSISLAIKNDAQITMRASSIMHYAQKHNQFKQDLEIAKQVFKDNLDAEILDRAINGTKNPVFQKGEYIGDYAVKDNKLLVEVAKAKLPETYNPRAVASANPQGGGGTTINIVSFEGADETKRGYVKNIGVVKSVDESGRVQRIMQSSGGSRDDLEKAQKALETKKMIDFYKKKEGAEVIEAEVISDDTEAQK